MIATTRQLGGIAFCVLLAGCVAFARRRPTPLQVQSVQTREYEESKQVVFASVMSGVPGSRLHRQQRGSRNRVHHHRRVGDRGNRAFWSGCSTSRRSPRPGRRRSSKRWTTRPAYRLNFVEDPGRNPGIRGRAPEGTGQSSMPRSTRTPSTGSRTRSSSAPDRRSAARALFATGPYEASEGRGAAGRDRGEAHEERRLVVRGDRRRSVSSRAGVGTPHSATSPARGISGLPGVARPRI